MIEGSHSFIGMASLQKLANVQKCKRELHEPSSTSLISTSTIFRTLQSMCIVAFALEHHPDFPLVLISNRDEEHDRPSAQATFWPEKPHILAGRDLETMGTWLGITRSGRLATLTNYLVPFSEFDPNAKKRGNLPASFLDSSMGPLQFLNSIKSDSKNYNGFNLLTYHRGEAAHLCNFENHVNKIERGVHGLCNDLLDTPWPKVEKLKAGLSGVLAKDKFCSEELFDLLLDDTEAADNELESYGASFEWKEHNGVPFEWRKRLSPIFVHGWEGYGTCSSTVIMIDREGIVNFWERTYVVGEKKIDHTVHFRFPIEDDRCFLRSNL